MSNSETIRIKIVEDNTRDNQLILNIFNLYQDERKEAANSFSAVLLRQLIFILEKFLKKEVHKDTLYNYFFIEKMIEIIYKSVLIKDVEEVGETNRIFDLIIKKGSEDKVIEKLQQFIVPGLIEIISGYNNL